MSLIGRLGAVLGVAMALAALAAPGAFAEKAFQAGEYPAAVSAELESATFSFTINEVAVECESAALTGNLEEEATETTVTPTYAECLALEEPASVAVENCVYRLFGNYKKADVICEEGAIKISLLDCEVQVGTQYGLETIEYVNSETLPSTILAKFNLGGVTWERTKSGFLCSLAGIGPSGTSAKMSGEMVASAASEETQVDLFRAEECPAEVQWAEEDCELWATEGKWNEAEEEWPEEKEEEPVKDPILFVHGFRGDITTFATMVERFETDGWPASRLHNWAYNWGESNVSIAEQVAERVSQLIEATGAEKVDIITHSMGGLSTRYYLKNLGGTAKVDEWVSLGGPNHGTTRASLCTWVYTSCEEMKPGSTFLTALNAGDETPGGVRYGTWRSTGDWVIVPEVSVVLAGAEKNLGWLEISHSDLHEVEGLYKEVRTFVE